MRRFAPRLHAVLWMALLATTTVRAQIPPDAVWIDVRSPGEYASGHLSQARSIPFDGIEAGVHKLQIDRDAPIYLYCAVGARAEVARKRLEVLGYSKVTNVGSLENARKLAGTPH